LTFCLLTFCLLTFCLSTFCLSASNRGTNFSRHLRFSRSKREKAFF
jgi:hypothetical protein